jgi:hypothetical protein
MTLQHRDRFTTIRATIDFEKKFYHDPTSRIFSKSIVARIVVVGYFGIITPNPKRK